jgi:hypothetical protein
MTSLQPYFLHMLYKECKINKLTFPTDEPINIDVIVLTHSVASGCFSNENLCKEQQ